MNLFEKLKHFILYGLGSASQALSGILILPLLTKSLSIEDFGVYSMITLCGSMASSIFYLGITSALPRFYFDSNKIEDQRKILSNATFIILIGATLQIIFGYAFSSKISLRLFMTYDYSLALSLTFMGYALLFLNQYILAYWRLLNYSSKVFAWAIINIFINFIGIYYGINYVAHSIYVPVIVFLVAQLVQLFISLFQTRELLLLRVDIDLLKSLTRFGLGVVIIAMGTLAIDWFDRFVVNDLLSLKDVAVYSFSYKIGTLINVALVSPFVSVWSPIMMKKRSDPNVHSMFTRVTNLYFVVGCCCTVLATFFFQDIVFLFVPKQGYSEIVNYFPVIMFGTLIYGLSNIFSAGYFYDKKIYGLTKIYISFALVNVGMTFFFVKYWQLNGAMWSSFLTYTMISTAILIGSRRYFYFSVDIKKIAVYSTIVLSSVFLRNSYFQNLSWINFSIKLGLFALFILVVYGLEFNFKLENIKKIISSK